MKTQVTKRSFLRGLLQAGGVAVLGAAMMIGMTGCETMSCASCKDGTKCAKCEASAKACADCKDGKKCDKCVAKAK